MTAMGVTTVASKSRPECHAPSGYSVRDYSGKPAANGIAPRDRQRDAILSFWEAQGIARWMPTRDAAGRITGSAWHVRDMLNPEHAGMWFPLASTGEESRADRAEFSHVRSARNGGAWCACNLLPEVGAVNASRGDSNVTDLPMAARAVLAAWPEFWKANLARKASLARLA